MAVRKNRVTSTNSGVPVNRSSDSLLTGLNIDDVWNKINEGLKNKSHLDRLQDQELVGSETDANIALLGSLNQGNGINENIAAWIDLMSQGSNFSSEIRDQLRQFLFQLLLNQDQRDFDLQQLADSRLYNSPTNELARLMGAGISRDAAIQLLSGSSGASSANAGVAGSAGVAAPSVPQTSGTKDLQTIQTALGGVADIVGAFCNLLNSGMSFSQGVESIKSMQFANYMNQQQRSAYDSVNVLTQAIQNMQLEGILTPADVDSWQNGNDVYKWLLDHSDTNAVKPLIQNGTIRNVFGTTYGRQMFNSDWRQHRESRDYGTQLNNLLRQNELLNDLRDIQTASARRDYYLDFVKSFQEIIQNDEEIGILWNDYLNGKVEVDIAGERLDIAKYAKRSARRQDIYEQSSFDAFQYALNHEEKFNKDGRIATLSGQDILNYNAFAKLIQMYENDAALVGQHGVNVTSKDGDTSVMSARERYRQHLNANIDAVITGAFINDVINSNRLSGYSGNLAPLYRFADMWNASGVGNMVHTITPNVNLDFGDKTFIKQP